MDKLDQNHKSKNIRIKKKKEMQECELCSKKFATKSTLRRHISSVHLIAPTRLKCPICEKMYTRRDNMKTHIKNIHSMNIEDFATIKLSIDYKMDIEKPKLLKKTKQKPNQKRYRNKEETFFFFGTTTF